MGKKLGKQAEIYPKVLLVEGNQDKRVIPELIEANDIPWVIEGQPIVQIRATGGYEALRDPDTIATELTASGLKALGIIVDADEAPQQRWQSIRDALNQGIPDIQAALPMDLPETGLIHQTQRGIRFGVWMMPDNRREGMLETFLGNLLPDGSTDLWEFAQSAARSAQTDYQAPYTPVQTDKAQIYTWLAWQNPPGRQLHQALNEKIFQPSHPHAQRFVKWFQDLYCLKPKVEAG